MPGAALDVDAVVVGAGLSGCAAAATLHAHGRSVALLEARDRVGGRAEVVEVDGVGLEAGGQWAGELDRRTIALAGAAGVRLFETYGTGRHLIRDGDHVRGYRGWRPRVDPRAGMDLELAIRRLNRLAREVAPDGPWDRRADLRRDGQTMAGWIARNLRTAQGRELFALAVRGVWGCEPAELSLLAALVFVRTTAEGRLEYMLRNRRGAQHWRIAGGPQQLAEHLVRPLRDALHLRTPVDAVSADRHGVAVSTPERTVRARVAVVALPPVMAGRLRYEPGLPVAHDQALARAAVGAVTKVIAVYARPFWRDEGLTGHGLLPGSPVSATYDVSPVDGTAGILAGFVLGRHARELARRGAIERRTVALDAFASLFGDRARRPDVYHEKDWAADPWSRGCFHSYPAPGALTAFGRVLRQPVGAIHFAGSENARLTPGGMNGALEAGEAAALQVLDGQPGGGAG